MAYTPTEWQTGDTITAEKLNNMESGIEGAQNGYTVETGGTTLIPEQSVTTSPGQGGAGSALVPSVSAYPSDGDAVVVSFDGTTYTTTATDTGGIVVVGELDGQGAPVFSTYPFLFVFVEEGSVVELRTETSGEHTISASTQSKTVTPNEDFKAAVTSSLTGSTVFVVPFMDDEETGDYIPAIPIQTALDAFDAGVPVLIQGVFARAAAYSGDKTTSLSWDKVLKDSGRWQIVTTRWYADESVAETERVVITTTSN